MMSTGTPQHQTVLKCTPKLLSAFKSNLIGISASLLSKSLISPSLLDEMNTIAIPMEHRACSLVRAISVKVEDNTSNYEKLIDILSEQGEFYKDLLAELQETLESFTTGKLASSDHGELEADIQPEDSQSDGNSQLQLDVEHINDIVMKDVEDLECHFDVLKSSTLEYLNQENNHSCQLFPRIRTRIASITGSLRIRHKRFYDQNSEKMLKTENFDQLFVLLCSYWHFNNISLLQYIIANFGNDELKKKMKQYEQDLQTFRRRTKVTDFGNQVPHHLPGGHSEVTATLDVNAASYTLEDAANLQKHMLISSMISGCVMQFSGGNPGSLILKWHMPSSFSPPFAHAMNDSFFREHCITTMSIDGLELNTYKEQNDLCNASVGMKELSVSEHFLLASAFGLLEEAIYLLGIGVNVDTQELGQTALIIASSAGHVEVVQELIKAGANLEAKDNFNQTAMLVASSAGHGEVVQVLMKAGAKVKPKDVKTKDMSGTEEFSFHPEICQNCMLGEQSLAFCSDCKRSLCNECHQQHKKQVDTAKHEIVESPKAKEIRQKYQCSTHSGQPLDFYCSTCNKSICDHCHKTQCNGHVIMVEKNVKEEISTQLEEVKRKRKEFESYREYITSVSEQNAQAIIRCEGDVDNAIEELIKELKAQKRLFHDQLREEAERIKQKDDIQLEYVEGKLDKLQKVVEDTEKLLESNAARVMVHRDSTLVNLNGVAQYSWNTSEVIPLGWQLKCRPSEEYASKFGKLIPKPRGKDILVEGLSPDTVPRVGFTNDFTITVNPAHQYKGYAVIKELVIKIKQRSYQKQSREEEIVHIINEPNGYCNKWSISYFLRTHGTLTIEVSVCGVSAEGSPFKLKTVEKETIKVEAKVVRGRDWKYGTQDGGEGCVGRVVEVKKDGWVMVKWPSQKKPHDYRWGYGDHYDLKVVD